VGLQKAMSRLQAQAEEMKSSLALIAVDYGRYGLQFSHATDSAWVCWRDVSAETHYTPFGGAGWICGSMSSRLGYCCSADWDSGKVNSHGMTPSCGGTRRAASHQLHRERTAQGHDFFRPRPGAILSSHIILSIVALPMVLTTLFFSLTSRFALHPGIARLTFPAWPYVSITGVVVFVFLKAYAYSAVLRTTLAGGF